MIHNLCDSPLRIYIENFKGKKKNNISLEIKFPQAIR